MKGVLAPVQAVVLDMGGVLTVDPFAGMVAYAQELGIPDDVIVDAIRSSPQFRAVETGESTFRDFLKWLCASIERDHGVRVEIRRLADCLASGQQVRPEMPGLLADLRGRGLRLGLLTNNAREARSWWESGVLPLEVFDVVVDSSEEGVRKPDAEIYDRVASRLGSDPEQIVFVDDLQENVDGALAVGMRGLLFRDPEQCRQELAAMVSRSAPAPRANS